MGIQHLHQLLSVCIQTFNYHFSFFLFPHVRITCELWAIHCSCIWREVHSQGYDDYQHIWTREASGSGCIGNFKCCFLPMWDDFLSGHFVCTFSPSIFSGLFNTRHHRFHFWKCSSYLQELSHPCP